jgi:peptidoglycan/xylan/chitin deacetylase (PgdA/CDA1 family)
MISWAGRDPVRNKRLVALLLTLVVTLSTAAAARPSTEALRVPATGWGPTVTPVPAKRKTVALTFDDGPSKYTPRILAVLDRHQIKATFCMLGDQAAEHRHVARQVARAGHRICNHTRHHKNLRRLSSKDARKEIADAQAQIRAATGVTPETFRFPYGASDARVRKLVKAAGLRNLRWNVDTRDWRKPSATIITARALRRPRQHVVVLMHDGGGDRSRTAASLDATIKRFRRKGYTFIVA